MGGRVQVRGGKGAAARSEAAVQAALAVAANTQARRGEEDEPGVSEGVVETLSASSAVLPSADAPADEIEQKSAQIILNANADLAANITRSYEIWSVAVGEALLLMKAAKGHQQAIDPATNKPYTSVLKWAEDRGVKKSDFYRLTDEVPVAKALRSVYNGKLTKRQSGFLIRVLRANNEEAVVKTWEKAESLGGATVENLDLARKALDYKISNEESKEPGSLPNPRKILALGPVPKDWDAAEVQRASAANQREAELALERVEAFRAAILSGLGRTQ